MEKAYAQLQGGYNVIGKKAPVSPAIEALTGREVTHLAASAAPSGLGLDPHQVAVVSSKHAFNGNPYGIVPDHAYSVLGQEVQNGRACIRLYNPWAKDEEPVAVPLERLGEWFESVDIGSVVAAP
jgi:hypothetical protein